MRVLAWFPLLLVGCGLTGYRAEREVLLRELRESPAGPYAASLDDAAPPPADERMEESMRQDPLGPERAVGYALARNPKLASAIYQWEALIHRVPQVSSFDDPVLQYVEHLRSVQTRSGPMERSLMLSQRLPWPGKLDLRGEMALEEARRAQQSYRETILRVMEEVRHAWADYAVTYRLIEINEELKRLLREFEQVARKKLEAARATQQDVLRAQIQSIHLEHHGIVLERDRRVAAERLNAVLNRPPRAPLGRPADFPDPKIEIELSDLLARARRHSPRLKAAEHAVAKAAAARSLASLDYLPDPILALGYTQIEGGTNPGFPKDGEDALSVTLGINLPVQLERRSGFAAEAESALRKARADYLAGLRDLERDVTTAYEKLVELRQESLLLRETLLPQTEQHLRAARRAYEAGDLDFLSLLDAERNIEGIRQDDARVSAEFLKARAVLGRAVGGDLP
ncbi:MAG: TolC family protein [Planctomycetes bacterium]|nr:TolC family protein [Planctomycetota bacterium]